MASENEKRETLADIAAEMRHDAELCHDLWLNDPNNNSQSDSFCEILNGYARRIEAAWKRDEERAIEHATRHAEAVARDNCRDCVYNPKGKNYEGGNAAATREALLRCEAISCLPEIREQQCVRDMRNIIAAAISAPARNCDLHNDVEDAWHDYKQFRSKKGEDIYFDMVHFWPFAKWLLAPAAERKGEGDGK